MWLHGSYKLAPGGGARTVTYALIALALAACLVGLVQLVRAGRRALAGWLVLMLAVYLIVSASATTWVAAKTLMLTSPAVVLAAWAGVAALRAWRWTLAAGVVAALLVGGVLVSDAFQYHSSDLAPTARYEELASLERALRGSRPGAVHRLRRILAVRAARPRRRRAGLRLPAAGARADRRRLWASGRPGSCAACGAERLSADYHASKPGGDPPAGRLSARLAGHLLRGVGTARGRAARARPPRARRQRGEPVRADRAPGCLPCGARRGAGRGHGAPGRTRLARPRGAPARLGSRARGPRAQPARERCRRASSCRAPASGRVWLKAA